MPRGDHGRTWGSETRVDGDLVLLGLFESKEGLLSLRTRLGLYQTPKAHFPRGGRREKACGGLSVQYSWGLCPDEGIWHPQATPVFLRGLALSLILHVSITSALTISSGFSAVVPGVLKHCKP